MATAVLSSGSQDLTIDAAKILNDEQIEALLQEAENNLRSTTSHDIIKDDTVTSRNTLLSLLRPQENGQSTTLMKEHNGIARTDHNALISEEQKKILDNSHIYTAGPPSKKTNDVTDAGSNWFNLPKTELTAQLKRDLQIIELRSVLDPHRHYKKSARKGKIPTFSQVGTVVEGATEFFSGRLNRKDRSKNFVEEAMKGEQANGRFKRKYDEIQQSKTSGKRGHYKKLMAKRKKK